MAGRHPCALALFILCSLLQLLFASAAALHVLRLLLAHNRAQTSVTSVASALSAMEGAQAGAS